MQQVGVLAHRPEPGAGRQLALEHRAGVHVVPGRAARKGGPDPLGQPLEALPHHLVVVPAAGVAGHSRPEVPRDRFALLGGLVLEGNAEGAPGSLQDPLRLQPQLDPPGHVLHAGVLAALEPRKKGPPSLRGAEVRHSGAVESGLQGPRFEQLGLLLRLHGPILRPGLPEIAMRGLVE